MPIRRPFLRSGPTGPLQTTGPPGTLAPPPLIPILLTNSAEGGTNGVTVTTGNSGGPSGNPFDTVLIGTGATLAFDGTQAYNSGLSYQVAIGSTSASSYGEWTTSMGAQSQVWFRLYLYWTANPSGNVRIWQTGLSGVGAWVQVTSAGKLTFSALNGFNTVLTSTNTIPLNQWFRVEGFVKMDVSVGQLEFKLFTNPASTVPLETQTSGTNLNLGAYTTNTYFNGVSTNITSSGPYWMDNLGLSNTGYIGPVAPTPVPGQSARIPISGTFIGPGPKGPRRLTGAPYTQAISFSQSAEAGTSGSNVTSSDPVFAPDSPFNNIAIGTGATVAYDNSHSAHGNQAFQVATTGTSTQAYGGWNVPSHPTNLYFRVYLYATSLSYFGRTIEFTQVGAENASIAVNASGQLLIRDANSATVATFTTPIPLNQWFRVEGRVFGDATSGVIAVQRYDSMDSINPTETQGPFVAQNTRGFIDATRFGVGFLGAANAGPFWMDDVALSSTGPIGPVGAPVVDGLTANIVVDGAAATGIATTSVPGPASGITVAVPGQLETVSVIGLTANITVASTELATVAVAGITANITVAAPSPAEIVNVTGFAANITVASTELSVVSIGGLTANITVGAPTGASGPAPTVSPANITVGAPAPADIVTVLGLTANINVGSAELTTVSVAGQASNITVGAPAPADSVIVIGLTANINVAGLLGSFNSPTIIPGLASAITVAAPLGIALVFTAAPVANITVTSPTGLPIVSVSASANITVTAPSGTIPQALPGAAASINVTAQVGSVPRKVSGQPSNITIASPFGVVSYSASQLGVPAIIAVTAQLGGVIALITPLQIITGTVVPNYDGITTQLPNEISTLIPVQWSVQTISGYTFSAQPVDEIV